MYYNDHPPAHVHVRYGEYKIRVTIESQEVLSGRMPNNKLKELLEWMHVHEHELLTAWNMARRGEEPIQIEPLIER